MVSNTNYQRKIQHRNFQPHNIFSKFQPKKTSTVIIANEAIKMNNSNLTNTNKTFYANNIKMNISLPEKDNSTSSDSINNKSKEINKEVCYLYIIQ